MRITGGPWRSTGDLGSKSAEKIISDTEIMKNTPIHVFDKSASVNLTTGIIYLRFTACPLGAGNCTKDGRVRRTLETWCAIS
jgi:hypothetical protein